MSSLSMRMFGVAMAAASMFPGRASAESAAGLEGFLDRLKLSEERFSNTIAFRVDEVEDQTMAKPTVPEMYKTHTITTRILRQGDKYRIHQLGSGDMVNGQTKQVEDFMTYDGKQGRWMQRNYSSSPVGNIANHGLGDPANKSLHSYAIDFMGGKTPYLADFLRNPEPKGTPWWSTFEGLAELAGQKAYLVVVTNYDPASGEKEREALPIRARWTFYFEDSESLWPVRQETRLTPKGEKEEVLTAWDQITAWQEVSGVRVPKQIAGESRELDGSLIKRVTIDLSDIDLKPSYPNDRFTIEFPKDTLVYIVEDHQIIHSYIVGNPNALADPQDIDSLIAAAKVDAALAAKASVSAPQTADRPLPSHPTKRGDSFPYKACIAVVVLGAAVWGGVFVGLRRYRKGGQR